MHLSGVCVSIILRRGRRTSGGGTNINGGSRISQGAATPKGEGVTTYYFAKFS